MSAPRFQPFGDPELGTAEMAEDLSEFASNISDATALQLSELVVELDVNGCRSAIFKFHG